MVELASIAFVCRAWVPGAVGSHARLLVFWILIGVLSPLQFKLKLVAGTGRRLFGASEALSMHLELLC